MFLYIFVQIFQWTSEFFFNFRFSFRKSQSQQKSSKKDHKFYNTLSLKKPISLDIKNNMYPQHSQKTLTLQIFQQICFCLVLEKNTCTAPFLDAQELHS